jgi:hypothetical protein
MTMRPNPRLQRTPSAPLSRQSLGGERTVVEFRRWAIGLVLVGATVTLGCSYSTTFFVLNGRQQVVHVQIGMNLERVKATWCILEPGKWFIGPRVVRAKDIDRWFEVQPAAEVRYDPAACTIDLDLAPGDALVLWEVSGYQSGVPVPAFPTALRATGGGVSLSYDGSALYSLFSLESRDKAVFRFK